jgi:formate hydrogenlyase transcriptional activator
VDTSADPGGTESPEEIRAFRRLLQELAATIVCSSASQIGSEIDKALEATGNFWNLGWVWLAELSSDRRHIQAIHSYLSNGASPPAFEVADVDPRPLIDHLSKGELAVLTLNPFGRPGEAGADSQSAVCEDEREMLILPVNSDECLEALLILPAFDQRLPRQHELLEDLFYLGRILAGSLARKKAVESISELRRFEELLSQISATYINLPIEEIAKTVKDDFERLGRLLEADRFNLYLINEDGITFNLEEQFAWWPHEDDVLIRKIEEEDIKTRALFNKSRYLFDRWRRGEVCRYERLEDLPGEAADVKAMLSKFGAKSYLSIPITLAGSTAGALSIVSTRRHQTWSDDLIPRLRLFGEVFVNAMSRKQSEEKLRAALSEVKKLKDRIEADYVYLREEIKIEHDFGDIVGKSDALKEILTKVRQVASTNATVLVLGETGTGKGLIARAIHNASARKDRPLIQVNCAALAGGLIESELFGHEKGAFTGAQLNRAGRFELANGTTLFLDEIGDLPLELQPKLLRVLQEGEFERVGGSTTIKTDVRIVAATNKDLENEVEEGRFRKDLWYRLNVFPIYVPPLRERLQDIPLFVSFFLKKYGKWIGKEFGSVHEKTVKALQAYSWPGNIRELENLIERAVITSSPETLQIDAPKEKVVPKSGKGTMEEMERSYIIEVLNDTYWRVNGPNGAAARLGMNPSTLRFRMKALGISRPASFQG